MEIIQGTAASGGLALGPTYLYLPKLPPIPCYEIGDAEGEHRRFEQAVQTVDGQIKELRVRLESKAGPAEAQVFEAHRMFLADPMFVGEIRQKIITEHLNAETCTEMVMHTICETFECMEDEYFRQRAGDIADVGYRLIRSLMGLPNPGLDALQQPSIVIAETLFPSDTAQMDVSRVLGFITATGGPTAHVAIFARSLGIPAVVGAGVQLLDVCQSQLAVLDGDEGKLIVNPEEIVIKEYAARQLNAQAAYEVALQSARAPATTKDGFQAEVAANIGQVSEAVEAIEKGAEGVGLLRTEFLFLDRAQAPDEDEQYRRYFEIGEAFGDRPVVIRTLDVGGDKQLAYLPVEPEDNPVLGLRGLRLCLAKPELLKVQIRAILRAAVGHNLKIMFPMVSSAAEIRQARQLVAEAMGELNERGAAYSPVEIGIMVEVPAAALAADILARYVDFFSIGTNDLTQYTLAADRMNASVQGLADAFHPAVLKLIQNTIRAGHAAGIWVGLCGELAGSTLAVPLLLGMRLDEFSMAKSSIPAVKEVIRKWSVKGAEEAAHAALQMEDAEAVRAYLKDLQPR